MPLVALTATADAGHARRDRPKLFGGGAPGSSCAASTGRTSTSPSRPRTTPPPQIAELHRRGAARPRRGDRLLRQPRQDRALAAAACGEAGLRRARLPRRAGPGGPARGRERVPARGRADRGATVAFGMGVDKPDIRWVAHADLPKSIGGATTRRSAAPGRDGLPAETLTLYGAEDIALRARADRRGPGRRGAQARRPRAAERAPRPRRGRDLPPAAAARLLRRDLPAHCGNCDTCRARRGCSTRPRRRARRSRRCCRTGGRFGLGHLVDVLRGDATEKVGSFGHDQLSVFGIGRDVAEGAWRGIARQLLARGALGQAGETSCRSSRPPRPRGPSCGGRSR